VEKAKLLLEIGDLMESSSNVARVFRNLCQGRREISERSVIDP